jgi:hypothetical protein
MNPSSRSKPLKDPVYLAQDVTKSKPSKYNMVDVGASPYDRLRDAYQ